MYWNMHSGLLQLGRSPGEGNGYPLWYPYLENSMDRGAQWATLHGVAKSRHYCLTGVMRSGNSLIHCLSDKERPEDTLSPGGPHAWGNTELIPAYRQHSPTSPWSVLMPAGIGLCTVLTYLCHSVLAYYYYNKCRNLLFADNFHFENKKSCLHSSKSNPNFTCTPSTALT